MSETISDVVFVKIDVDDIAIAKNILITAGAEVVAEDEQSIAVTYKGKEDMGKLNAVLIKNNVTVYSIAKEKKDLENLFLDITSKN